MTAETQEAVHRPDFRPDRRSSDPLARLSRQLNAVCTTATDPLEISAVLEASGMTDAACRQYGHDDVFSLAQQLFAMVPRRGATRRTQTRRRRERRQESLLRGVLYALPGLVVVGLSTTGRGIAVVLAAMVVGWGWAGALAHVGHMRIGWHGRDSARALLRTGLLVGIGLVLATVAAAIALTGAVGGADIGIGVAVGVYLVAAGTLLVLGADRLLLLALAPGAVGGFVIATGAQSWSSPGSAVLPLVTVLATAGFALAMTKVSVGAPGGERSGPRRWPTRQEVRLAAPHLAYGALCALAVGLGPVTLGRLTGEPLDAAWYVTLPLVLSMGPIELQLSRLRDTSERLLWRTRLPEEFVRGALRALSRAVGATLAVVSAVAVVCWVVLLLGPSRTAVMSAPLLVCYAVLATCLFLGLVLVATGRVVAAVTGFSAALVVYLAAAPVLSAVVAYAAVFAVLFVVLLVVACRTVRSPLVHI